MPILSTSPKRPLILCVDDDPPVLTLLTTYLELGGFTVLTATDGHTALRIFAAEAVNAVVLDYDMPGMNGAQLAFQMKQLKPDIPKLLFTAYRTVPPEAGPHIEGFCSKTGSPQPVLTWLRNLIGPFRLRNQNAVTLQAHIAIARLAPEWAVKTPA